MQPEHLVVRHIVQRTAAVLGLPAAVVRMVEMQQQQEQQQGVVVHSCIAVDCMLVVVAVGRVAVHMLVAVGHILVAVAVDMLPWVQQHIRNLPFCVSCLDP